MELNKNHVERMERHIAPPMAKCITIPVITTENLPITIYVTSSGFGQVVPDKVLKEIARRLELKQ